MMRMRVNNVRRHLEDRIQDQVQISTKIVSTNNMFEVSLSLNKI